MYTEHLEESPAWSANVSLDVDYMFTRLDIAANRVY